MVEFSASMDAEMIFVFPSVLSNDPADPWEDTK